MEAPPERGCQHGEPASWAEGRKAPGRVCLQQGAEWNCNGGHGAGKRLQGPKPAGELCSGTKPPGVCRAHTCRIVRGGPEGREAVISEVDGTTPERSAPSRRVLGGLVAVVLLAGTATANVLAQEAPSDSGDSTTGTAFEVAGTAVSETELARRIEVLEVVYGLEAPDAGPAFADFRRGAAQTMATALVLDDAAREAGVAASENEVDRALDRYARGRYGGAAGDARAAFLTELSERGIDEDEVREEIRRQLTGQQLFDLFTAEVSVPNADVRDAYDRDPGAWAQPERRGIRTIVTASRAAARRAVERLRRGADFAREAQRSSLDASTRDSGGDLGVLRRRDLDPVFGAVAFTARQNVLFGPLRTELGWYIGEVTSIEEARTSFSDLRADIRASLTVDLTLDLWNTRVLELVDAADVQYAASYEPGPGTTLVPPVAGEPR